MFVAQFQINDDLSHSEQHMPISNNEEKSCEVLHLHCSSLKFNRLLNFELISAVH
jgi:hypothetical protein